MNRLAVIIGGSCDANGNLTLPNISVTKAQFAAFSAVLKASAGSPQWEIDDASKQPIGFAGGSRVLIGTMYTDPGASILLKVTGAGPNATINGGLYGFSAETPEQLPALGLTGSGAGAAPFTGGTYTVTADATGLGLCSVATGRRLRVLLQRDGVFDRPASGAQQSAHVAPSFGAIGVYRLGIHVGSQRVEGFGIGHGFLLWCHIRAHRFARPQISHLLGMGEVPVVTALDGIPLEGVPMRTGVDDLACGVVPKHLRDPPAPPLARQPLPRNRLADDLVRRRDYRA